MSIFEPESTQWGPRVRSILRIVIGLMFITHGTQKMFGVPPSPTPLPPFNLFSQLGLAALIEIVGGTLITWGLFTRPVALVLAGEMAVAYFMMHFPRALFPASNFGEPAVLYCLFFLYLLFAGPGPLSIDAVIARNRRKKPPTEAPRRLLDTAA